MIGGSALQEDLLRLADQARKEALEREPPPEEPARKPLSPMIWAGVVLMVVELVLLLTLGSWRLRQLSVGETHRPSRLISKNDCTGALYKTYRGIADYIRDHGHPPASLSELVGEYVSVIPVEPQSGKPLRYSTHKSGFELRCLGGK